MEALELSLNHPALTSEEVYRRLMQIIGYEYDRYTGMQTFHLPLLAQGLNHSLYANCRLIILMKEDRTWSALLNLAFQVRGRMTFPSPGEAVNWLINGHRATSYIIDSNGHTVSQNFRVGTDVMPGPLTLWVSAPVTVSRTSGSISIWLSDDLLRMMCAADAADFRVAGMEFRLTGNCHANKGIPHPLAHYISGLRGFVEQRPDSPDVAPLLDIANKMEQSRRRSQLFTRIGWSIIALFVLLIFGSCFYLASQTGQKPNANSILTPSPSPSETLPVKKVKPRKD